MSDIASLGLKVDSSQVVEGTKNLDDFSDAAGRAEAAAEGVGKTIGSASDEFEGFGEDVSNIRRETDQLSPGLAAIRDRVAGMAIPFVLTAGAVALLTKAWITGAQEAENYARAIALTGNAAGVTVSQLAEMAEHIDDVVGTQAKAAESLAAIAGTGKVQADNLERFARIAIEAERTLGTPIKETAEAFASLAEKPTEAAAKLQKSFNFLTPAVYDYIRAQEKAGNVQLAASAAQQALADATDRAIQDVRGELNLLGRALEGIKDFAKEVGDEISGIGRKSSLPKQIAELENARDRAIGRGFPTGGIEDEIERLKKLDETQREQAKAVADAKEKTDAYIRSQEEAAKSAEKWQAELKRINDAWDSFDFAKIRRSLQTAAAAFDAAGDELEAQRAANLVTDEQYYAARRELVEKSIDFEIAKIREENAALKQRFDNFTPEGIAAQNQVADNNERIAQLRTRRTSQLNVLETQQAAALRNTRAAYAEAQASADRYVETLERRMRIESEGLGLGDEERKRLRERADIEADFVERRERLERDLRRGDLTQQQFDEREAIERDALARSLASYDHYYSALKEKQADWKVGAMEAIRNFYDDAMNRAKQFEDVFTRGLNGMADALVDFAVTGKSSFGDLAKSILADLLRIELRIALSQILNSLFGGFSAAAASGAGASASQQISSARWGDFGRFGGGVTGSGTFGSSAAADVPDIASNAAGMVSNMSKAAATNNSSGGGISIVNHYNIASGVNAAQVQAIVEQGSQKTKSEIFSDIKNGRWGRAQ